MSTLSCYQRDAFGPRGGTLSQVVNKFVPMVTNLSYLLYQFGIVMLYRVYEGKGAVQITRIINDRVIDDQ